MGDCIGHLNNQPVYSAQPPHGPKIQIPTNRLMNYIESCSRTQKGLQSHNAAGSDDALTCRFLTSFDLYGSCPLHHRRNFTLPCSLTSRWPTQRSTTVHTRSDKRWTVIPHYHLLPCQRKRSFDTAILACRPHEKEVSLLLVGQST